MFSAMAIQDTLMSCDDRITCWEIFFKKKLTRLFVPKKH